MRKKASLQASGVEGPFRPAEAFLDLQVTLHALRNVLMAVNMGQAVRFGQGKEGQRECNEGNSEKCDHFRERGE